MKRKTRITMAAIALGVALLIHAASASAADVLDFEIGEGGALFIASAARITAEAPLGPVSWNVLPHDLSISREIVSLSLIGVVPVLVGPPDDGAPPPDDSTPPPDDTIVMEGAAGRAARGQLDVGWVSPPDDTHPVDMAMRFDIGFDRSARITPVLIPPPDDGKTLHVLVDYSSAGNTFRYSFELTAAEGLAFADPVLIPPPDDNRPVLTFGLQIESAEALTLTATAVGDGSLVSVALTGEVNPSSVLLSCVGFDAPVGDRAVAVKKNRVLPFKARLVDANGLEVDATGLATPPVIQVGYAATVGEDPVDVSEGALAAGTGTDGNQFEYGDGQWQFNLKTKNYTSPGIYHVEMVSGDADAYLIAPLCVGDFVVIGR